MARILAVDWDGVEIRFVLGNLVKDNLTVLKAGSGPIEETADEEGNLTPDIGGSLHGLLAEHRVGKNRLLVGLRRGGTEVLHFELPPATDEELPQLVKNQMLRDSPTYIEGAPVDYLVANEDPTEQRRVTVGALTRSQLRKLQAECRKAGQRPARIELRAPESASVLRGSEYTDDAPVLLVNRVGDEADFTVLLDQKIVYLRSVLLPGSLEENEIATRILAEVNRTLAVGLQEADSARAIEKVLLFGSEEEHEVLVDKLRDLPLEVELVDPFELSHVRAKTPPENPGRYTALLGMIFDESPLHKPAIDFLHPKETPKPPNYARWIVIGILLLIGVGTGLYFWNKSHLASLNERVAALQTEYDQLSQQYRQVQTPHRVLSAARQWESQGLVLLDELRDMSVRFPDPRSLVLTQMTFTSGRLGGRVNLRGMVRDPAILNRMRQALMRDGYHNMNVDQVVRNPGGGGYPWVFQARIECRKRPDQAYLRYLSKELQQLSQQPPPFIVEQQKKLAQQKAEMLAERKAQLAEQQKKRQEVELPVNFDQLDEQKKKFYLNEMSPQEQADYRRWALAQQQQQQKETARDEEVQTDKSTEASPNGEKKKKKKEEEPSAEEQGESSEQEQGPKQMTQEQYQALRRQVPAFLQSLPPQQQKQYMQMTPEQKEAYHQRVIRMLHQRQQQQNQSAAPGEKGGGPASGETGLTFQQFRQLLGQMPRFFQTLPAEQQQAYREMSQSEQLVFQNRLLVNMYLRGQSPRAEKGQEKQEAMPVTEQEFGELVAELPEYFQSLPQQQQQAYGRMNPMQRRFFQIRSVIELHRNKKATEKKPEPPEETPKPKPEPEAKKKPAPKPEPEKKSKPPEETPKPKPEPEPEKKPDPKPEPEKKPEPPEETPKPKPEPEPEKKPAPKPEPEKKPEPPEETPKPKPEPEPEKNPAPEPEPEKKPES